MSSSSAVRPRKRDLTLSASSCVCPGFATRVFFLFVLAGGGARSRPRAATTPPRRKSRRLISSRASAPPRDPSYRPSGGGGDGRAEFKHQPFPRRQSRPDSLVPWARDDAADRGERRRGKRRRTGPAELPRSPGGVFEGKGEADQGPAAEERAVHRIVASCRPHRPRETRPRRASRHDRASPLPRGIVPLQGVLAGLGRADPRIRWGPATMPGKLLFAVKCSSIVLFVIRHSSSSSSRPRGRRYGMFALQTAG